MAVTLQRRMELMQAELQSETDRRLEALVRNMTTEDLIESLEKAGMIIDQRLMEIYVPLHRMGQC